MKIVLILFFLQGFISITFNEAMIKLKKLENYIKDFHKEYKNLVPSLTRLITTYIREGEYNNKYYNFIDGGSPDYLDDYITKREKEDKITVKDVIHSREIKLPNGESFDFAHLFATMDGIICSKNFIFDYVHLTGWGGDTVTLAGDIKNEKGTLNELMIKAKNILGKEGHFDSADLITDLDAPILLNKKLIRIIFLIL